MLEEVDSGLHGVTSLFTNERVSRVNFTGKRQKQGGKLISKWPGGFLVVFPKHVGSFYPCSPNQLIQQASGMEGHGYSRCTLRMGKGSLHSPCPGNLATPQLIIIWWVMQQPNFVYSPRDSYVAFLCVDSST